MTYLLIAVGLLVLFWFVSKLRRGMSNHDAFFTQVKFIQMYMSDVTEKSFYNKSTEEAMNLGQEMLWSAAEDFNERMHRAVVEKQPIPMGDMGMIISAIRIIKAAEAMVYIQNNGPIHYDDSEEPTVKNDSEEGEPGD